MNTTAKRLVKTLMSHNKSSDFAPAAAARETCSTCKDISMRTLLALFGLALFTTSLSAQEESPVPPSLPAQSPEASKAPQDQELQPEVTITKHNGDVFEEYRINGQLYMVKITPSKGLPYYLMDSDGDGSLETRRNELDNPEVVKWRIFSW
jgi:hypothetical protein